MNEIGLTDAQIKGNLLFVGDKIGETMKVALDPKQAKAWFGATPPDLSVVARSRSAAGQGSGADYLYTYLRTYYRDDTKPTGWNNLAFPNVGMPHVLWELQGERRPIFEKRTEHGQEVQAFTGKWEVIKPGSLDARSYDAAVADLVGATQFIARLKECGCHFALDDFGSGFSSLAYLKQLPVDYLKIDGAFVRDMADEAIDLAMVRAINDIGHLLGKRTVAEFVESAATMELLRTLGVDFAQGYAVGRPVPIARMQRED